MPGPAPFRKRPPMGHLRAGHARPLQCFRTCTRPGRSRKVCRGRIYASRGGSRRRARARSGQDRSLQSTRYRGTVGRGLDPSAEVFCCRTRPGRHICRPYGRSRKVCRGRIYASRGGPRRREPPVGAGHARPCTFPQAPAHGTPAGRACPAPTVFPHLYTTRAFPEGL